MRPLTFPVTTKSFQSFQFIPLRFLVAVALICGCAATSLQSVRAQTAGQTLVFPTSINWPRQQGVNWYRLQIGGDETFRDIYLDRRVVGDSFRVRDLEPGYYYWRIATADDQVGAFSRPLRFFVPGGVVTPSQVRSRRL